MTKYFLRRNSFLLFLFFNCFCGSIAVSQTLSVDLTDSVNTRRNIRSYYEKIIVRSFVTQKYNELQVEDREFGRTYNLRPNTSVGLGFGFNYHKLGLNLAFNPGFINNDDQVYGKTRSFGFTSNMYRPRGGIDLAFQIYDGYYLHNAGDYIDLNDDLGYPRNPSLSTLSAGISGFYALNPNYSMRSSFTQQEWMEEKGGSWLVGGYILMVASNTHNGDSWMDSIPGVERSLAADLKEATILSTGVNLGYIYTWRIAKHWFITSELTLISGVKMAKASAKNSDVELHQTGANFFDLNYKTRFAAGYDTEKYQIGLKFFTRNISMIQSEEVNVRLKTSVVTLIYAHRFNVKKNLLTRNQTKEN